MIFILFIINFACGFFGNFVSNGNHLSYEAIFNFGNSPSDNRNATTGYPSMNKNGVYGSTYFNHPSGHMSNGQLIIDFIGTFTHYFYFLNKFFLIFKKL